MLNQLNGFIIENISVIFNGFLFKVVFILRFKKQKDAENDLLHSHIYSNLSHLCYDEAIQF